MTPDEIEREPESFAEGMALAIEGVPFFEALARWSDAWHAQYGHVYVGAGFTAGWAQGHDVVVAVTS